MGNRFSIPTISGIVIILALYAWMMFSPDENSSWGVYASNAVIVIFSLFCILNDPDRSYSARKILYLFVLFFMGVAPLLQYKNGTQTVGGYDISEVTYVKVNLLMIGVLVVFEISYKMLYNVVNQRFTKHLGGVKPTVAEQPLWRNILLGVSIACVLITLWYFHDDPARLFIRGYISDAHDYSHVRTYDTYLQYLINWVIRPLPALCCLNYLAVGRDNKIKGLFVALMLLTCFPTGIERLRTATYYIALIIILFPAIRYKNRFPALFCAGFLFVFPLLNNFRRWATGHFSWPKFDLEMFCDINYDSYQSFAFAVQKHFIDFFGQVSEFLLFWIPRYIWPDKPQMSGYRIAHEHGLSNDFIAMNFWGEGYIAGGIAGVFILTIALAWLLAKLDKYYWISLDGSTKNIFAPFYLLSLSLIFFCLRGDLVGGLINVITLLGLDYLIYRLSKHMLMSKPA